MQPPLPRPQKMMIVNKAEDQNALPRWQLIHKIKYVLIGNLIWLFSCPFSKSADAQNESREVAILGDSCAMRQGLDRVRFSQIANSSFYYYHCYY